MRVEIKVKNGLGGRDGDEFLFGVWGMVDRGRELLEGSRVYENENRRWLWVFLRLSFR